MPQGGKRRWLIRIAAFFVILVAVCCWVGTSSTFLKTQYAAYRLRSAGTDEERNQAANQLVSLGSPGLTKLIEIIQSGNDSCRTTAAIAIDKYFASVPDGDPRAISLAGQIITVFSASDEAGQKVMLEMMFNILKRTGNTYSTKCRQTIATVLKTSNTDVRLLAIRLALHPEINMRMELLPLLADSDPRVRGAALFGAATATDDKQIVADEDLFRWLHDPDPGVRKVCYDALVSRDRSETEINLARRLSNPETGERLKLLYDLRYEDDVLDPEPWLERLSRDQEPALRAGAARVFLEVMTERKLSCPTWIARVSENDPDPTVRRIASYYRKAILQPVREVRPVSGP